MCMTRRCCDVTVKTGSRGFSGWLLTDQQASHELHCTALEWAAAAARSALTSRRREDDDVRHCDCDRRVQDSPAFRRFINRFQIHPPPPPTTTTTNRSTSVTCSCVVRFELHSHISGSVVVALCLLGMYSTTTMSIHSSVGHMGSYSLCRFVRFVVCVVSCCHVA